MITETMFLSHMLHNMNTEKFFLINNGRQPLSVMIHFFKLEYGICGFMALSINIALVTLQLHGPMRQSHFSLNI